MAYDPFGTLRGSDGPLAPFLFTGEQYDPNAGLYYLRARYYDPAVGRFISKDPFSGFVLDPLSQQPYAYARNNPINFVDHSGLQGGSPGPFWDRIQDVLHNPDLWRWIRRLTPCVISGLESTGGEWIGKIIEIQLENVVDNAVEHQLNNVPLTVLVPARQWEAPTRWPIRGGAAWGGLVSGMFQYAQDLGLCLTVGQRLGRAGIAAGEGFLATLAVAGLVAGLGLAGAPAVVVGLGIGIVANVAFDYFNTAWLFPNIGLAP